MMRILGSEPDTGAIREPESPTGRLLLRDLQAFASPDPLDPFMIHTPAIVAQQPRDLTIAVAALLTRTVDNRLGQGGFIIGRLPLIALCGTGLTQHSTDPAFCEAPRRTAVLHGLPSARWA